jgi:hypothetical protein
MITVIDQEAALRSAAASQLTCPNCGGTLRRWSNARTRTIRLLQGEAATWTPPRLRCRDCARTHVVHAVQLGPRHAYGTEVLTTALVRAADGTGHRAVAAGLGLPADTVRGWLRRARGAAEDVRIQAVQAIVGLEPDQLPTEPSPSSLAEALRALAVAARLAADRWKIPAPLWQIAAVMTRARLFTEPPSG